MDGRVWMGLARSNPRYIRGCQEFMDFAYSHPRPPSHGDNILCPSIQCANLTLGSRKVVYNHLLDNGIMRWYVRWTNHGESRHKEVNSHDESQDVDEMHAMLHDALGVRDFSAYDGGNDAVDLDGGDSNVQFNVNEPNKEAEKFFKLLKEANTEIYPGATKFSKLSFLVRLLHIKCLNGWSNKSFDMLLELLKEALPDINLPKNYYASKAQLRDLGMGYIKIHACPNDCMLYWKDKEHNIDKCDICGVSRWKLDTCVSSEGDSNSSMKKQRKPAKVLRYFPLKPRLQRLFTCSKTSEFMRWHAEGRVKDGVLRHPADSMVWRNLDKKYPLFASETRNVRLAIASDGFNPFGNMSTSHSTWPVIVIPYNVPPWMCMKQSNFILSMLIPGPSSPGNDIDVYMQPLVDELNELWADGVQTYDACSKQNFQMRAAYLWTISDFPAYANLSGWSTKGYLACPCCHKDTRSDRLVYGSKCCYMGHRRFLPLDHMFRKNKNSFNGSYEVDLAPKPLTGNGVLDQLSGYDQITFGKASHDASGGKRKRDANLPYNWKKIPILSTLPYYKDLLLPHNLDVMHTEKNNAESFLGTLLNIEGKTKDNLKARQDMELMGIRPTLHPELRGKKYYLPPAKYTTSLEEKRKLCQYFFNVKVPDNYSSNISGRFQANRCKLSGLKSHDYHVLIQQLLPVAARGILHKDVTKVLVGLSTFYKKLCSKTLREEELIHLESQIMNTLCQMEMVFPPSFFDVMTHLPVHLAGEARLGGPVPCRWMYPVERYLGTQKKYVRNKCHPEGSIAEAYIVEECLTFCSRYLDDGVETRLNRLGRNDDGVEVGQDGKFSIFAGTDRPIGKRTLKMLSYEDCERARLYVLRNCDEVAPFIEKHKEAIKRSHRNLSARDLQRTHNKEFGRWFEKHVFQLKKSNEVVSEQFDYLSRGPKSAVACFRGYIVNGFRFKTKQSERGKKTQNSGLFVSAETSSFASASDGRPLMGNVGYYGVLTDVMELHYHGENKITLFKGHWFDVLNTSGIKQDGYGYTSVNPKKTLKTNNEEPFIFATQAQQVFYVEDNVTVGWNIVMRNQARDLYDMGEPVEENESTTHQDVIDTVDSYEDVVTWNRTDISGVEVDVDITNQNQNSVGDSEGVQEAMNEEEIIQEFTDEDESIQEFTDDDDDDDDESDQDSTDDEDNNGFNW